MRLILVDLDTRAVLPAERFTHWLDSFSRAVVPLDVRSDHIADFIATMRMLDLGVIRVVAHRYPPLEAHRPPRLIRRHDPGLGLLFLNLRGEVAITQSRCATFLGANEFTFVDSSSPFRATHSLRRGCTGQVGAITIPLGHTLLPVPPEVVTQLSGVRMSGQQGVGALLSLYLRELTRHPERYQPSDVARLGTVTLDLLVATLAHYLDAGSAADVANDQAMLARIHAFVDRRIADPELSPRMIAAAHHISPRTLHRLFHTRGTTVARWIRSRRLERCRRDLADNLQHDSPIRAISARWGFRDGAHFSRAFRAEYDMSPHEFRERQQELIDKC